MKYYIAENGQPAGPFELKELLEHGLTVNSQVWNESMENWTTASQVPEVYNLLQGPSPTMGYGAQPQNPVGQPTSPYEPQPQPQQQYASPSSYGQDPFQGTPGTTNPYVGSQQSPQSYGQQQYYGQHQYAQPQYAQPHAHMPNDWKMANIIVTILSLLCCCNPISLVTGIIGIVKSGNVRTLFNHGDQLAAEEAAESAKKWFFITLILMIVLSLLGFFYVWNDAELSKALMEGYNNGYIPK